MFDIKFIRDHPDQFDSGLARRNVPPKAGEVLALDEEARKFTQALNDLQSRRNAASKAIGAAKAKGDEDEFNRLRAEVDSAFMNGEDIVEDAVLEGIEDGASGANDAAAGAAENVAGVASGAAQM